MTTPDTAHFPAEHEEKMALAQDLLRYDFEHPALLHASLHAGFPKNHPQQQAKNRLAVLGREVVLLALCTFLYECSHEEQEGFETLKDKGEDTLSEVRSALIDGQYIAGRYVAEGLDATMIRGVDFSPNAATQSQAFHALMAAVHRDCVLVLAQTRKRKEMKAPARTVMKDGKTKIRYPELEVVQDRIQEFVLHEDAMHYVSEHNPVYELRRSIVGTYKPNDLQIRLIKTPKADNPERYTAEVTLAGKRIGFGNAAAKIEARRIAAKQALQRFRPEPETPDWLEEIEE